MSCKASRTRLSSSPAPVAGFGEATARLLSAQGASVVLGARREDRIEALARAFTANGGKAIAMTTDVTDRAQVKKLVDSAVEAWGRIDVLINNAGLMPQALLERLKIDEWDRTIDVNLKGVLHGIVAALPYMQQQKSGHFINVSSVAGHIRSGLASRSMRPPSFACARSRKDCARRSSRTISAPRSFRPAQRRRNCCDSVTDLEAAARVREFYAAAAIPAASFARLVAFAISQPDEVDINEIVLRPTRQEY